MVQALCDLWFVDGGPLHGELGWCLVAVSGVWSVGGVVDPPIWMITRASRRLSNRQRFSNSSRSLPLNDSIHAFCHGETGLGMMI